MFRWLSIRPGLRPPRRPRTRRGRQGIALVVVLGVVAVLTVLAASLGMLASVARVDSRVFTARTAARYQAESAQALVTWMVISDRATSNSRAVGQRDATLAETADERLQWRADGALRPLTLAPDLHAHYALRDANSGWDIANLAGVDALQQGFTAPAGGQPAPVNEELVAFFDSLRDYLDPSATHRLHGAKAEDYAALGQPGVPRKGPIQDRTEVFWVPHVAALVGGDAAVGEQPGRPVVPPDLLRVVPPPHQAAFPVALPSFFAASPALLTKRAALSPAELQVVLEARRRWYQDLTPIQEGLGDLYGRLSNAFSFTESGVYTVAVTALGAGQFQRRLTLTLDLRKLPSAGAFPQLYLCAWEYQLE